MGINTLSNDFSELSSANKLAIGVGAAGVLGIAGLGTAALIRKNKRRKSKRRKNRNSRKKRTRNKKFRRTPYTSGKRRDTSHRRIRYTKKGQPYVIMGNGRARFIKKSSAKRSHKLKGGRY